jgi:hypothetical protein
MKRLMMAIMALCFITPVFASKAGWFTGSHGYPFNVTVTSMSSVTLFNNDGEVQDVQYENRTGFDVYLTTYAFTQSTPGAIISTITANAYYRKLQSGKWPPFKMDNTGYRFAISSATTPSGSELYIDINK